MKRLPLILALALLPMLASAAPVTLAVKGMHCAFCAQKVEANLREIPTIESVEVDVDAGRVDVETAGKSMVDDARLTKAIEDAGYQVTSIERP